MGDPFLYAPFLTSSNRLIIVQFYNNILRNMSTTAIKLLVNVHGGMKHLLN